MTSPRFLPVVEHHGQQWYFDERLRQLRTVANPHEYHDLDDEEFRYFQDLVGPREK